MPIPNNDIRREAAFDCLPNGRFWQPGDGPGPCERVTQKLSKQYGDAPWPRMRFRDLESHQTGVLVNPELTLLMIRTGRNVAFLGQ